MSQPHPTLINLPQPPSNPDTPSEIPGTPTSTTTSLSALSTTAIKDGHRGALHHRGHHHSPSTNSLEAERADRISRLTGLGSVSTLRGSTAGAAQYNVGSQPTSASAGYPLSPAAVAAAAAAGLTPAYFNAAGQPVAINKVSTVGSASATESVGGHTSTTEVGGDQDTERDEDMLTEMDSASASGYMGGDTMDEDLDNLGTQSVGGFEDRMSDDGSASLVGFGEGAGSTVSGPIYQRRPLPAQGPNPPHGVPGAVWGLERTSSGLSEGAGNQYGGGGGGGGRRDGPPRPSERDTGAETPVSQSAVREQREARMMDGVALDSNAAASGTGAPITTATLAAAGADDTFVDTTTRGPVPVSISASSQSTPSTARETWSPQPRSSYSRQLSLGQSASSPPPASPPPRETAERIIRERLDGGEGRVGNTALGSPKGEGERLGKFYFEGHSR